MYEVLKTILVRPDAPDGFGYRQGDKVSAEALGDQLERLVRTGAVKPVDAAAVTPAGDSAPDENAELVALSVKQLVDLAVKLGVPKDELPKRKADLVALIATIQSEPTDVIVVTDAEGDDEADGQ